MSEVCVARRPAGRRRRGAARDREDAAEDGEAERRDGASGAPAPEPDPLALLFRAEAGDPLAVPDLERGRRRRAERAPPGDRHGCAEEIRRVLLGYDLNPARGERLVDFLDQPLPEGLSEAFRRELAEIRFELTAFADVEQLFIRAPRRLGVG